MSGVLASRSISSSASPALTKTVCILGSTSRTMLKWTGLASDGRGITSTTSGSPPSIASDTGMVSGPPEPPTFSTDHEISAVMVPSRSPRNPAVSS